MKHVFWLIALAVLHTSTYAQSDTTAYTKSNWQIGFNASDILRYSVGAEVGQPALLRLKRLNAKGNGLRMAAGYLSDEVYPYFSTTIVSNRHRAELRLGYERCRALSRTLLLSAGLEASGGYEKFKLSPDYSVGTDSETQVQKAGIGAVCSLQWRPTPRFIFFTEMLAEATWLKSVRKYNQQWPFLAAVTDVHERWGGGIVPPLWLGLAVVL